VEPLQKEFLPVFDKGPVWYGWTASVTNDWTESGVLLEVGRDENDKPILETLFRLADCGEFDHLPRFGMDQPDAVLSVAKAAFDFSYWMAQRKNKKFLGLAVIGDVALDFYPDSARHTGCRDTMLPHVHGFGNTANLYSLDDAAGDRSRRRIRQPLRMPTASPFSKASHNGSCKGDAAQGLCG